MNVIETLGVLQTQLGRDPQPAPAVGDRLIRAVVLQVHDSGEIAVRPEGDLEVAYLCDVLLTGARLTLTPQDLVLVLVPRNAQERGVILGLIGPYTAPSRPVSETVDHLKLEATESLLLKCGEGSLEMRKDGKVLLQGKDVVSRAKRLQRIKGGTVAIN